MALSEMAGVASKVWPMSFAARISGSLPSRITVTTPSSLVTYALPSARTGEAENWPLSRRCHKNWPFLASTQFRPDAGQSVDAALVGAGPALVVADLVVRQNNLRFTVCTPRPAGPAARPSTNTSPSPWGSARRPNWYVGRSGSTAPCRCARLVSGDVVGRSGKGPRSCHRARDHRRHPVDVALRGTFQRLRPVFTSRPSAKESPAFSSGKSSVSPANTGEAAIPT